MYKSVQTTWRPYRPSPRRAAGLLLELRGEVASGFRGSGALVLGAPQLQQASRPAGICHSGGLDIVYTRSRGLQGGPSTIVYRLYTLYTLCIWPTQFLHILQQISENPYVS